jgi:hypothetical protein
LTSWFGETVLAQLSLSLVNRRIEEEAQPQIPLCEIPILMSRKLGEKWTSRKLRAHVGVVERLKTAIVVV